MAHVKSRKETEKEIASKAFEEVGTMARDLPVAGHSEAPTVISKNEGGVLSGGGSVSSANDDFSGDESSLTYCFSTSTITLGRIREMVEKGYFGEGEARSTGEETTLEPQEDEAVVYEDIFVAGIRMLLHPTLADILLKFQVQLHQLMPNAIA
jgi:hypothetical protein